ILRRQLVEPVFREIRELVGYTTKTLTDTPAFSPDGKFLAFSFAGYGPWSHGWSYYVGLFRLPGS
ncbi:MAG: hypothetical protein K6T17_10080, partial [Fimbriimonadales bacterium]|nr:hypothetical protein [Fimbriimonadales bacterium]